MSADAELQSWTQAWKSSSEPIPDLSGRVRRQSRRMRLLLAGDVLVTILIGGAATVWAAWSGETDVIVLAAAVWVFIAAAWAFSIWLRRGCWTPAALDNSSYLDISVRRCRSGLAISTFAAVLCTVEVFFSLGWVFHRKAQDGTTLSAFLVSVPVLTVAVCAVVFAGAMVRYRRKTRSELQNLTRLQQELDLARSRP